MTSFPKYRPEVRLGVVVDLDLCTGCHGCAVACKEWNTSGHVAPLPDFDPFGAEAAGVWLNRVHGFEASGEGGAESGGGRTVHLPLACLHCELPYCIEACPTGATYKRQEDGIVLIDEDRCIGCMLCAWACPYGARDYDHDAGVMKSCTMCIDRIYNDNLDEVDRVPACVAACPTTALHFGDLADPDTAVSRLVAERDGKELLPELNYAPNSRYLPPKPQQSGEDGRLRALAPPPAPAEGVEDGGFLQWIDRLIAR